MSSRRRAPRAGTILFVDDDRWTGFDQLSAVLRRHGLRTVRITSERSVFNRRVGRLCYDETILLDDLPGDFDAALTRAGVNQADVLDMQCGEFALALLVPWLSQSDIRPRVKEHLMWRADALDKFEMSTRLSHVGIPVPRALDAAVTTPQEAAELLGYPLLLKPRLGYGGIGLHVFDDEASLTEFAEALDPGALQAEHYWDEFAEGTVVRYVACYEDGRVLQEGTYVSVRWDPRSLGPATSVRTNLDDELLEVGRRTLATIGGRGLANIECIRSDDGRVRVIDVNLRAWGSVVTLGQAGVDFGEAYTRTLTAHDSDLRPAVRTRPGLDLRVFPDASVAIAVAHPMTAMLFAVQDLPYFIDSAGVRYGLAAALTVGLAVYRFARHSVGETVRARGRRRAARHVPRQDVDSHA